MIENETKGWYGSYSLAGKNSAEKYNNIIHKNEILKGETKKVKIHDMFTPDEPKNDIIEENLDIFKMYSLDDKFLKKKIKEHEKNKAKKKIKLKEEKHRYFFHNKHCLSNRKKQLPPEPACTRYHPNYNYIWPKLLTGPKWSDLLGRKQKKLEIDNRDFVINNLENYDKYIMNNGDIKCFVNMNKTTQRGNFVDNKDLRIRTDRPFSKTSKPNYKQSLAYELTDGATRTYLNGFYRHNILTEYRKKKKAKLLNENKKTKNICTESNLPVEYTLTNVSLMNSNVQENKNMNKIEKNNLTYDEKKVKNNSNESKSISYRKKKNIKSFYIDSKNATMGSLEQAKDKVKNPAPDFSKIISREQREKVKAYKIENVPFIIPNYSYVRERPIVTAIYKKDKKNEKYKKKEFFGVDSTLHYDPDSIIEKYNNHLTSKITQFKYMISRPNKKGSPLPFYMQQVHDRSGIYLFTDKSLQLNKYSEGKYIPASSTFFPKKSFNNIINVGFANSKSFKEFDTDEDILAKKMQIKRKLELRKVDYEELLNEGALNKFDNFSFKTILKKKKKEGANRPIISFEVNEENDENNN
jgi:hypothetical protein